MGISLFSFSPLWDGALHQLGAIVEVCVDNLGCADAAFGVVVARHFLQVEKFVQNLITRLIIITSYLPS